MALLTLSQKRGSFRPGYSRLTHWPPGAYMQTKRGEVDHQPLLLRPFTALRLRPDRQNTAKWCRR